MKKIYLKILFFTLLSIVVTGCCKSNADSTSDKITFRYNGKEVTYGIVKRVYTKSINGVVLDTPEVRYWLDRNIGAERVALSKSDSLGFGHYFQYGRGPDGHQLANSDTTWKLSQTLSPGHSKFITQSSWLLNYDYLKSWTYNSGPYNPCPNGWRVANIEDWTLELNTWLGLSSDAAFASELKIPAAGARDYSNVLYNTQPGYWFRNLTAIWIVAKYRSQLFLYLQSSTNSPPPTYVGEGVGACVRCVKGE
jgi:hypothetical protein